MKKKDRRLGNPVRRGVRPRSREESGQAASGRLTISPY
ncbi:hypothetical protein EBA29_00469 [Bacillus velezensis]|uniref:Uncharacterized protein n=1 Tax=Bacillus amyloliquefaciens (strain Y2) TaxID=1155777 RepID=I2C1L1_BACAY|nr:hypothetical protein MUS_0461 [Bacillus velezensis YAU B9601-Y2]AFZ89480.1 hypothetical protein B938_02220 [Bacillus velezensis AS43.3]AGZ55178.1 hypothetical protein U471_04660 [Bacillus amyloliquefaciens CC178]ERH51511.1 hypothetical protein O205_13710 [Bacillus amyloliquefaciens EGD-AQ14]KYC87597.1 hypothetical protein B4140_0734 [Bacillus amyloliquefaciens]QAR55539.1 hypothetical protein EBA29_00469 [Bacillus velezensis]